MYAAKRGLTQESPRERYRILRSAEAGVGARGPGAASCLRLRAVTLARHRCPHLAPSGPDRELE